MQYAYIQGLPLHIANSEAENPRLVTSKENAPPVADREKGDGPFYWRILKKTEHYSGFDKPY